MMQAAERKVSTDHKAEHERDPRINDASSGAKSFKLVLTTRPNMKMPAPTPCCTEIAFWKMTKLSSSVTAFLAVVVMAECSAPNRFVRAAAQLPPMKPAPQKTMTANIAFKPCNSSKKKKQEGQIQLSSTYIPRTSIHILPKIACASTHTT